MLCVFISAHVHMQGYEFVVLDGMAMTKTPHLMEKMVSSDPLYLQVRLGRKRQSLPFWPVCVENVLKTAPVEMS